MEKTKFYVLVWNIDNFSHWDNEIHERVITCPWLNTTPQYRVELYPRGLSGKEEHLEIRLCSSDPWIFSGEVSLIVSDGSRLCNLEVKSKHKLKVLFLDSGPTFDEVVDKIRKNEVLYNDRLTLQYRFECGLHNTTDYICTAIDVMDISLKVSSEVLQNSIVSTALYRLYYSLNEDDMRSVILGIKGDKLNKSKVLLTLRPDNFVKKFSILTRMTILNNEDEVRTEENKYIFRNDVSWTFSNSFSIEEFVVKGYSLILYFKITPSIGYRQYFRFKSYNTTDVTTTPPYGFKHLGRSVCEGACNKSPTALASNPTGNSVTMLATELMCLYQDSDFSDFKLKCGKISFQVHRAILGARSPVFKTMLSTNMKEAESGCVDIKDLDAPTLSRFLAFLYSGTVEDLQWDSALKLYYVADKYQVPTLQRECVSVLCAEVSISNVCDVLSLANKHQDDELIGVARDFILKHYNEVLGSEEWEGFMKNEPLLAVETVTHFAKRNFVAKSTNP